MPGSLPGTFRTQLDKNLSRIFFFSCLKFHKLQWLNIIMKDKIKTNRDAQSSCVGCTENVIKRCQVVSAAEI